LRGTGDRAPVQMGERIHAVGLAKSGRQAKALPRLKAALGQWQHRAAAKDGGDNTAAVGRATARLEAAGREFVEDGPSQDVVGRGVNAMSDQQLEKIYGIAAARLGRYS